MSKVEIKLIPANIKEVLLKSDDIIEFLNSEAKKVQSKVGDGYEISKYIGNNRANVSIHAANKKTYYDNLENNTLLKAIGNSK